MCLSPSCCSPVPSLCCLTLLGGGQSQTCLTECVLHICCFVQKVAHCIGGGEKGSFGLNMWDVKSKGAQWCPDAYLQDFLTLLQQQSNLES